MNPLRALYSVRSTLPLRTLSAGILAWLLAGTPVQAAPFAYITNLLGNSVSVIDTVDDTVSATIDLCAVFPCDYSNPENPPRLDPIGVAVGPGGDRVYVAVRYQDALAVIDTEVGSGDYNTVIDTVSVGSEPWGVAASPDGTRVYVTNSLDNSVSVVDTADYSVVETVPVDVFPQGVAVNPSSTRVYVASVESNTLSIIDTSDNAVIDIVGVGPEPKAVAVNPHGTRVYVANHGYWSVDPRGTISVIDTAGNRVIATLTGPNRGAGGIAVHPDGSLLYMTNRFNNTDNTVSVFSALDTDNPFVADVTVEPDPLGVSVHPDGTRVYVANQGHFRDYRGNTVSVIDTATNTLTDTITLDPDSCPTAFGQFIVSDPVAVFAIGGTVSGLAHGNTVVLQNNGGDDYPIAANGAFSFPTGLADASPYAVTVLEHPTGPDQTCTVVGGEGVVDGANVTSIQVTCTPEFFTIGGTVSGLAEDNEVVLQNNDGDDLVVASNGGFTFDTPLADESPYTVTVLQDPTGQVCSVANGTGTVTAADVTNVEVTCEAAASYTVTPSAGANGSIDPAVPQSVDHGQTAQFTVTPAEGYSASVGGTCGGSLVGGVYTTAPVTGDCTVEASFTPSVYYTIGGTVAGLVEGNDVLLQNNLTDDLTVYEDGGFTFHAALADGSSYRVTVLSQPAGQTCRVSNGSGVVSGADVTNVQIDCTIRPEPRALPGVMMLLLQDDD